MNESNIFIAHKKTKPLKPTQCIMGPQRFVISLK